ncbi:ABC transporter permease [Lactiplantibacillus pentosus]|uniref:carbohydrate ABC transporter permease n=1 Tax=Lactiplantibacillus pentosus TaxID=1589 RepID=UPI000D01D48F|nr:carbohydrate ABC transporter permease [Lactiplantibacillus pentosus]PRO83144.1 ABC transporter permease [Lactiplantibacillus pentosus]
MRQRFVHSLLVTLLILVALIMLVPFFWMLWTSVQPPTFSLTLPKIPAVLNWQNYLIVWQTTAFARYYANSILVALTTTIFQLFTSILAAFAFTHLQFYGRRLLFKLLIITMMIPGELLLVPNFMTLSALHWIDTYAALIIPWIASVFMMFTLHQAFESQSRTSYYAARIDGGNDWQYLWYILVPMHRTIIIAVALLQLISSWNAFMWPLIVTNSDRLRTLPLGLINFSTSVGTNYPLLMTSTALSIFPLLILYLFLQRFIITGISKVNLRG